MSDTPEATFQHERPWTPGPWHVEVQSTAQARAWQWGVHHAHEATDQYRGHNLIAWEIEHRPDADLIALAPDMAEAILAFCPAEGMHATDPNGRAFDALAGKLRAIGATNA